MLGHGGEESVPRLVEALVRKKVVGAAAGSAHTAAGQQEAGHGGQDDELVPRLVEALVGKKVIGTADEGIAARPPLSLILIWTPC